MLRLQFACVVYIRSAAVAVEVVIMIWSSAATELSSEGLSRELKLQGGVPSFLEGRKFLPIRSNGERAGCTTQQKGGSDKFPGGMMMICSGVNHSQRINCFGFVGQILAVG